MVYLRMVLSTTTNLSTACSVVLFNHLADLLISHKVGAKPVPRNAPRHPPASRKTTCIQTFNDHVDQGRPCVRKVPAHEKDNFQLQYFATRFFGVRKQRQQFELNLNNWQIRRRGLPLLACVLEGGRNACRLNKPRNTECFNHPFLPRVTWYTMKYSQAR